MSTPASLEPREPIDWGIAFSGEVDFRFAAPKSAIADLGAIVSADLG
jgi:hypothetical protein